MMSALAHPRKPRNEPKRDRGRWIVHHDLPADSARDNLASSMKLPREGSTRLRIAKQKGFVIKDLLRAPRCAVALMVVWSGAGDHPRLQQLPGE